MSDTGVELLRRYKHWCIDGTFYSAPKHFKQMMTVNVFVDERSSVPAAYVLLPDKRQVTYVRALSLVFDDPLLKGAKPESFISGRRLPLVYSLCKLSFSDFELGLINSLSQRWPEAEERLCHFHLCQSLFKNIQQKKLLALYEADESRVLLRCFGSLALLPEGEVVEGFNDVCAELRKLIPSVIPESYRSKLEGT